MAVWVKVESWGGSGDAYLRCFFNYSESGEFAEELYQLRVGHGGVEANKDELCLAWHVDGEGWQQATSSAISLNTWYHVAGTISSDSGVGKLYVDGELVDTYNGPGAIDYGRDSDRLYIGARGGASRFMDGVIECAMIWGRVLSAEEIMSLYRDTYQMFREDNIALWKQDEAPPSEDGRVIIISARR
jgi:hypothetical protein